MLICIHSLSLCLSVCLCSVCTNYELHNNNNNNNDQILSHLYQEKMKDVSHETSQWRIRWRNHIRSLRLQPKPYGSHQRRRYWISERPRKTHHSSHWWQPPCVKFCSIINSLSSPPAEVTEQGKDKKYFHLNIQKDTHWVLATVRCHIIDKIFAKCDNYSDIKIMSNASAT